MDTMHLAVRVEPDGSIVLRNLPFKPGEELHVVVSKPEAAAVLDWRSLRGMITRYDDPFAPAASPDDWEALQ